MKNKSAKKMRGPTLQEFDLVPITDPAELEALDRRCKAAKEAMAAAERIADIGSLMMNLSPKAVRCVIAALDRMLRLTQQFGCAAKGLCAPSSR